MMIWKFLIDLGSMNYNFKANVINIIFLMLPVFMAYEYLFFVNTDFGIGRVIIFFLFIGVGFLISDWYHFYFTNSIKGVFGLFSVGMILVVLTLLIELVVAGTKPINVESLMSVAEWDKTKLIFKLYFLGIGAIGTAIYSLPRLFLIKLIDGSKLPENSEYVSSVDEN